jgi:hypothetical protein
MKGLEKGLWSFPGHWIYIGKIYRQSSQSVHPLPNMKSNYML